MEPTPAGLREVALDLYRAARAAGQHEVAYHALCAVLHAAEALGDDATCELVEREAKACRDAIDAQQPRHKLSSQSARLRGHESIFQQLAVMGESARLRLEADRKRKGRPQAPLRG